MGKKKRPADEMWIAPKHTLKPERTPVGWERSAAKGNAASRYLELADIALRKDEQAEEPEDTAKAR